MIVSKPKNFWLSMLSLISIIFLSPIFLIVFLQTESIAQPGFPSDSNFIQVQGGSFYMGSKKNDPNSEADEMPRREVNVSTFFLSKYEVTVGEFKNFINQTGYQTDSEKRGGSGVWNYLKNQMEQMPGVNWSCDAKGEKRDPEEKNHPVIHVSWNDAQAYIRWLNHKKGKNYRLPTEAEWEFAAQGGLKKSNTGNNDNTDLLSVAWFSQNSGRVTHPVGQKQANELGLFDMLGNACEWCSDWFGEKYYERQPDPDKNPKGPAEGQSKMYKGSCYGFPAAWCRPANRYYILPDWSDLNIGFRLAYSIKTETLESGEVRDIDGNVYHTIEIGDQVWLQENLNVTRFQNGDTIETNFSNSEWNALTTGAYAVYKGKEEYNKVYGKLYNGYAVIDSRKLCPVGWHIPSPFEWGALEAGIEGNTIKKSFTGKFEGSSAGGSLKSQLSVWKKPNAGAKNYADFLAYPGGNRNYRGFYDGIGESGHWWVNNIGADEKKYSLGCLELSFDKTSSLCHFYLPIQMGYSVRCVKD